jgi:hypothetical protein
VEPDERCADRHCGDHWQFLRSRRRLLVDAAADVLALVDECERRGLDVPEDVDVERMRSEQRE